MCLKILCTSLCDVLEHRLKPRQCTHDGVFGDVMRKGERIFLAVFGALLWGVGAPVLLGSNAVFAAYRGKAPWLTFETSRAEGVGWVH